ncbi:MAG: hypothetical protein AB7F86_15120 [Bdellovibrionales bacterium]
MSMELNSKHLFRTSVLTLATALLLAACASDPNKNAAENATPILDNCSGDGCGVVGGILLLTHGVLSAGGGAPTKSDRNAIYGRCQIVIVYSERLEKKPCEDVELKVFGPGANGRGVWVQGDTYEITGLQKGNYRIEAKSEAYRAHNELKKVRSGSELDIQIKLEAK